jgi:hypothetical protein
MAAASDVFSIAEILQQILSELPPLDIIRYERVNSTWRKLITGSPLLQYKSWLRNDYPDPAHHVRADDLIPEYTDHDHDTEKDYENKRYIYNLSKHLNPIVVARIMQHPPEDPRFSFDPLSCMDKDGFGGYLNFCAILLRDLMQWYKNNKATEHIWGHMSLFRPDARRVSWETPTSGGAGIPFILEAVRTKNPDAKRYRAAYMRGISVNKKTGKPLILTLSDLMGRLDDAWDAWIESEREEHYCSHDGGVCDFDQGIPSERCLESENEEDEVEKHDDEDEENEEGEETTSGTKMTMEEHIERAVIEASS